MREPGCIATSDEETLYSRSQDAALDPELGAPRVPLDVDDPGPTRSDDDVVDVRFGAGDTRVVKHRDRRRQETVEPAAEALFPDRVLHSRT